MIKYGLYREGGEFIGYTEEDSPLPKPGKRAKLKDGRLCYIVDVTHADIALDAGYGVALVADTRSAVKSFIKRRSKK